MHPLPFSLAGNFYRGNLHCHSNASDGSQSPEAICRLYRDAGYDFISVTDHFISEFGFPLTDTSPFREKGFTTLLGAELHGGAIENGTPWHILAVGLPPGFPPIDRNASAREILALATAAGAFTALAHPAWYGLSADDARDLGRFDAVEIYNGGTGNDNDSAESSHFADVLLARGGDFSLIAVDDAHIPPDRADFNMGWVMVKAAENESGSILAALKAGAFYSSTGPIIHDVRLEGDTVLVRCTPAERVFLSGTRPDAECFASPAGVMEARLSINRIKSDWARVTVRDRFGNKAWTNPFRIR